MSTHGLGQRRTEYYPTDPCTEEACAGTPSTSPQGPTPPSQALNKLRKVTDAAEAENQQRHELKDAVDGRLIDGKEANLRALLASLENVLWPEPGWTKVGMHEVITPAQKRSTSAASMATSVPVKVSRMSISGRVALSPYQSIQ